MFDASSIVLTRLRDGHQFAFPDLVLGAGECALLRWNDREGRQVLFETLVGVRTRRHRGWRIEGKVSSTGASKRDFLMTSNPEAQISGFFAGLRPEFGFPLAASGADESTQDFMAAFFLSVLGLAVDSRVPIIRMSSGEKQRLLLASALACCDSNLFFDDALDFVDPYARQQLLAFLQHIVIGRQLSCLVGASDRWDAPFACWDVEIVVKADAIRSRKSESRRTILPPTNLALSVHDLAHIMPGGTGRLFNGISFDLFAGSGLTLEGPNGSGKSTLGSILSGRILHAFGSVKVCGHDPAYWDRRRAFRVSIAPADPDITLSKSSVDSEIGFVQRGTLSEMDVQEILAHAGWFIEGSRNPFDLAWHERKILSIIKAIKAADPILFVDEPSIGLNGAELVKLAQALEACANRGLAVIVATNDKELVERLETFKSLELPSLLREFAPETRKEYDGSFVKWVTHTLEFSFFWAENVYPILKRALRELGSLGRVTLLDLGCGHGLHAVNVAEHLRSGGAIVDKVVGIDKNQSLVRAALEAFGDDGRNEFVVGDLTDEGFVDELGKRLKMQSSCIVVTCLFSLHDIESLKQVGTLLCELGSKIVGTFCVLLSPPFVEVHSNKKILDGTEDDDWTSKQLIPTTVNEETLKLSYYMRSLSYYIEFLEITGLAQKCDIIVPKKSVYYGKSLCRSDDVAVIWGVRGDYRRQDGSVE